MMKLKEILQEYACIDIYRLGGSTGDEGELYISDYRNEKAPMELHSLKNLKGAETINEKYRENLCKKLTELRKRNNLIFWICFLFIISFLLLSIFIAVYFIDKPQIIQTVFAASGLSIVSLIAYMNKIRKEKEQSDLLIILTEFFPDETVKSIVVLLAGKLFK